MNPHDIMVLNGMDISIILTGINVFFSFFFLLSFLSSLFCLCKVLLCAQYGQLNFIWDDSLRSPSLSARICSAHGGNNLTLGGRRAIHIIQTYGWGLTS